MLFGVPRTNAPNTLSAQGGLPSGLSKYANWCLQVYVLVWVVCTLSTWSVHRLQGDVLLVGWPGTVAPLPTGAAFTPWCSQHESTVMLHMTSFPRLMFGGCSSVPLWEM